MLKELILDETISKYYDKQMNGLELINFEAELLRSNELKCYVNKKFFEYYTISNSIKLVKSKLDKKSLDIFKKYKFKSDKSLIDINAVRFKRFYKHLRNRILNIFWNNS